MLSAGAAPAFAVGNGGFAPPSAFRYATTCQRCCSLKLDHDGIPLFGSPCVMNQKIAPSAAVCVGPAASAGMLPVPPPVGPWHAAQCRANKFAPACAAARLPAYGFFVCSAFAGALWNAVFCAETGKHTPMAANTNTDACRIKSQARRFQLLCRTTFKISSAAMVNMLFARKIHRFLRSF